MLNKYSLLGWGWSEVLLDTVGCMAAPLASAYQMPIYAPPTLTQCCNTKNIQTLSNVPWGQGHLWLRNTAL